MKSLSLDHYQCLHPPHRQYCGHAKDENMNDIMWIACLVCHVVREVPYPMPRRRRLRSTVPPSTARI